MRKTRARIIGSCNIGNDVMIKIMLLSNAVEMGAFRGHRAALGQPPQPRKRRTVGGQRHERRCSSRPSEIPCLLEILTIVDQPTTSPRGSLPWRRWHRIQAKSIV
jgi:hypothetical protein